MKHRVVITGMGVSTPVGRGVDEFWTNLVAGRSGISGITLFDATSLPVRIGGEVKQLPIEELAVHFPEAAGEHDRKVWLGLDAARQAILDSGLDREALGAHLSFVAPTGSRLYRRLLTGMVRSVRTVDLSSRRLASAKHPSTRATKLRCAQALATAPIFVGVSLEAFTLDRLSPLVHARGSSISASLVASQSSLQTPLDRLTQILGDHYDSFAGRYTNCSACAAGAQVVGEAFWRVREGVAPVAIAGAADSTLNPLGLGGFSLLQILSTENDRPEEACRPFDATRQGTVLSEGAAFLILERLEHALARKARIWAEVLGYGSSMDAYRVTDPEPNGSGAALSMTRALADAGLSPKNIDSINAHGTGTLKNDIAETLGIKKTFGECATSIPVTANKSMTGHMIATSGASEAVASAMTVFTGKIPPTRNLRKRDPLCDLDYVTEVRDLNGRTVLSNSFGFGGQNASLILGRWEGID